MFITIGEIFVSLYSQTNVSVRFCYIFWSIFIVIYAYASIYDHLNGLTKPRILAKRNWPWTLYIFGVLSIVIYHSSIYYSKEFSIPFFPDSFWIASGCFLMIVGLIIICIARASLDGYWGPNIYEYNRPEHNILIQHGIYKKIRHPVYYAQILMSLGTVCMTNNYLILVFPTFTCITNVIRAKREEKDLEIRFSKTFSAYREKTWGIWIN